MSGFRFEAKLDAIYTRFLKLHGYEPRSADELLFEVVQEKGHTHPHCVWLDRFIRIYCHYSGSGAAYQLTAW